MPLRWKELMGVKEIDNNLVRIKDKKKNGIMEEKKTWRWTLYSNILWLHIVVKQGSTSEKYERKETMNIERTVTTC